MKRVIEQEPRLAPEMVRLMSACIDLKEQVKQQVYLPVPTYSIKGVAPALGFSWRHEEVGAFESMVLYWKYLETGDREHVRKVLDYNEDDCKAMAWIDQKLCSLFGTRYPGESVIA